MAEMTFPSEKLDGCNILVTGATGLVGSAVVELLMKSSNGKYNVIASGRNEERGRLLFKQYQNKANFSFFSHDITKPIESDTDFHYIINAASNAAPNAFASHPVEVVKANILGTLNLLEYGKNHNMKRFLFISTGEIYGQADTNKFCESDSGFIDSMQARSCYPSSKRTAETLCAAFVAEYGMECVVARLCHTFGPHFTESDNRVYAQFIRNVLNGEDIVLKSKGDNYRSWIYVKDATNAIVTILLKGENGNAYNVANENSNVTILHLAETIAKIAGKNVVFDIPDNDTIKQFTPIKKAVFDTTKLQTLGWKPLYDLESALKETIREATITVKRVSGE